MDWAEFRELIGEHFNLEEIRTLCFDLDIDYDSLPGEGKEGKIRELVAYTVRNDRFSELLDRLASLRSDASWAQFIYLPEKRSMLKKLPKKSSWKIFYWWEKLTESYKVVVIGSVIIGIFSIVAAYTSKQTEYPSDIPPTVETLTSTLVVTLATPELLPPTPPNTITPDNTPTFSPSTLASADMFSPTGTPIILGTVIPTLSSPTLFPIIPSEKEIRVTSIYLESQESNKDEIIMDVLLSNESYSEITLKSFEAEVYYERQPEGNLDSRDIAKLILPQLEYTLSAYPKRDLTLEEPSFFPMGVIQDFPIYPPIIIPSRDKNGASKILIRINISPNIIGLYFVIDDDEKVPIFENGFSR